MLGPSHDLWSLPISGFVAALLYLWMFCPGSVPPRSANAGLAGNQEAA